MEDKLRLIAERYKRGESPIQLFHEYGIRMVERALNPPKGEKRSRLRRRRKERFDD